MRLLTILSTLALLTAFAEWGPRSIEDVYEIADFFTSPEKMRGTIGVNLLVNAMSK